LTAEFISFIFAETFVKAGEEVIKLALSRYGLSGDARDKFFEKDVLNHKRASLKARVQALANQWRESHPAAATEELAPTSLGKRPAGAMEQSDTEQENEKRERPPPGLASSTTAAKRSDMAALMTPREQKSKGDESTATASPSPAPNTSSAPEEEDDEVVFLSHKVPEKPQPKRRESKKASKSTAAPALAQRLRG